MSKPWRVYIVFKYEFPFTYPVLVGVAPKQFQKCIAKTNKTTFYIL